ncbi:nitrogenase stabilizing/protective protein NifW [Herbaspirillum sp. AP02]|uniref:nitrogenase stabilizing/protective protein NifW n=1 Tax=unclassified Herbaspirillum TaxID=2624150 RepID=UPI0018C9593F|nr:nitrogenase stabilizing/protective protein NifW [Herbaspirillum sp. AP02]MBG7618088.1 nitrogenase stabilizing/protective protein NifW [Herbaspirillum sp. AP02]
MPTLAEKLKQLSAAEEFLDFFGVPYQQAVVNVNRLHILKRFYQYMRQERGLDALDEVEMFKKLRALLASAYDDFVHSTPAQEKVFKVFQDAHGKSVSLEMLRMSLPAKA